MGGTNIKLNPKKLPQEIRKKNIASHSPKKVV
jgi:hypothetical protein